MSDLRYRYVLSDLDGTLADTFPRLRTCALQALEKFGITPVTIAHSDLRSRTGQGAAVLLESLANRSVPPECLDHMLALYAADPVSETVLFPGTSAWFDVATVAVVTNKPRRFAEPIIAALCPPEILLVCPEDAGSSKPDPAMLRYAMLELGAPVAQTVYIGDDLRDQQAAAATGVDFVAVTYGYGRIEDFSAKASFVISKPSELSGLIDVQ